MQISKRIAVAMLCLGMSVHTASAQEQNEETPARFSVGTGLGFPAVEPTLSRFWSLDLAGAFAVPRGVALVEFAQTERLRWLVAASADYSSWEDPRYPQWGSLEDFKFRTHTRTGFAANLGLRYVLNPQGRVTISPTFVVGGTLRLEDATLRGENEEAEAVTTVEKETSRAIEAVAGLTLEYELLKGLLLRFEQQLLKCGHIWHYGDATTDGVTERYPTSKNLSATMTWQPSMHLRLEL